MRTVRLPGRLRTRPPVDLGRYGLLDAGLRDRPVSAVERQGTVALVSAKQQRGGEGCRVTIVAARGIVGRLFDVTGLAHELDG